MTGFERSAPLAKRPPALVRERPSRRYQPENMGDDPTSLGVQASRNLCNLAIRELQDVPGVVAHGSRTLEVHYGDRVLHAGKAPSDSPGWDVQSLDWAESEVQEGAAAANTAATKPSPAPCSRTHRRYRAGRPTQRRCGICT